MKTCKYGHPLVEGEKYCVPCKVRRGAERRARVAAGWRAPVYLELAIKPWRIET